MFIQNANNIQNEIQRLSSENYSPEFVKAVIELNRILGRELSDHALRMQRDKPVNYRYQDRRTGRTHVGTQYDRNNGYLDYVGRERGDLLAEANKAFLQLIDKVELALTGEETDFIKWLSEATVCCGPLEGRRPKGRFVRQVLENTYGNQLPPAAKRALAPL